MNKEYKINDILDAVDSIYKVKKKKDKNIKTNNEYAGDNELMTTGEKKSNKSDVLVLDQMIE